MRKFVLVMFVLFTASVFAFSSVAQRRGRGRGRGGNAAARPAEPPQSPRIAQELGGIQWGWTHDQVLDYFRRSITARYQPQLRNKGQVEQDRLMQQRDDEINSIRTSYIQLNGQVNQRRWDTSFIGSEYTHNNNESLMVHEDPQTGSREFFFFFNDRLWKRYQARSLPRGARLEFGTFIQTLEGAFGPGLRQNASGTDRLARVDWQDANTRLHVEDQSTFYAVFALVYEEKATLARLAELRRNAPAKTQNTASARPAADQPQVGNVEGDGNEDIVDRITGKMRRVQTAPNAPAGRPGSTPGSAGSAGSSGAAPSSGTTSSPPPQGGTGDDPLRGL